MDERGRKMRAPTKGDMYAAESDRFRRMSERGAAIAAKDVDGEGDIPVGARVNDYEIESKIGEGAMGAVYRAVHPAIGRRVAIKVMTPKVFDEPDAVKRFVAEARAVAAIRHPGIVDIFGFGRLPDGRTYLVMEWLEGATLGEMLKEAPIPHEEACDFIRQIARALEAAHSKGIVHRDLKPENVFIHHIDDEKPVTKLLDFGLAKVTTKEDRLVARTRTGQLLGTPLYMSPEQCKSKGVDHRTDVYALGCMGYELLAGRVPFDADNVAELISQHLMAPPPRPTKFNPNLAPELDELLFQMISKDPVERPTLAQVRRVISQSLSRPSTPLAVAGPLDDVTPPPWGVPPGVMPAPPTDPTPAPTPPPALGTADMSGPRGIVAAPIPPRLMPNYYAPPAPEPAPEPPRTRWWPLIALATIIVAASAFAVFVLLHGLPW